MEQTTTAKDHPAVTNDAFLGGALSILQLRSGYRAGLDAVMLAAAVGGVARRPLRVLDVGAGVGTAGLCVARRLPFAEVVLLEKQRELADLAAENVQINDLSARVRAVNADIGARVAELRDHGLVDESFGHVIANPPYHDIDAGTLPPDALKAGAHAMDEAGLDAWVRFMARMAVPGGMATVVHKAEALGRILAAFDQRFGGIRVLPLHPRIGTPAHRVIVQGTKGSRAPLQVLPGFVLHGSGNGFTPEAQDILRHGGALAMQVQADGSPP
jgi:tRNA1(Val) A37 N6-methylase TrmN6